MAFRLPVGWKPTKNTDLNELKVANHPYILRCVIGTFIYWCMFGVCLYCGANLFNDIDTSSTLYVNIYQRIMVNTTYFPIG